MLRRPFWTEAQDAELRNRWRLGEPCAVIAAALGKSKNAVVGRAHRLVLPPHASRKVAEEVVMRRPYAYELVNRDQCLWPLGDPRRPEFRFCGAPKDDDGDSYCAAHKAVAYDRSGRRVDKLEAAD
jgi:GcrA cell cycle regulator